MNELLQANIFFVIASVATVIFFIIISFILFQIYKIVVTLRKIVTRIEVGSESLVDDVAFVRSWMKGGLTNLFNIINVWGGRKTSKKRRESSIMADEE